MAANDPGPDDTIGVRVERLLERLRPIFAHTEPELQGAVLAELLALWVAGHYQGGIAVMEKALAMHIEVVRQLVGLNIEALQEAGL